VTGILVGVNNDIGMVGVCPKAKVMPVKVLDKRGNGNLFTVAEGIRWAADHGANFIQMSLGSPSKVQNVRKAIQYAESKGVVTFVAAGNAGKTDEIFYPANYKETISVGAIDENFRRADFSCTGRNLDFMAPGVDIFSTVPPKWYATLSGTSMACPFIVGVATLVLSYVKSGKKEVKLTCAEDYREIFRKNTIHVTDENLQDPQFFSGFGIIDPRLLMDDFQG
jgi:thermitase